MEMVKKEIIQFIQSLPDDININDIMDELYFKLQVDNGLKELEEGKSIPHDDVEQKFKEKWLQK
jgi:predicted transcriptional regulator